MYDPTGTTKHFGKRAEQYRAQASDVTSPIARKIYLRLAGTFEELRKLALGPVLPAKTETEAAPVVTSRPVAPVAVGKARKPFRPKKGMRPQTLAGVRAPESPTDAAGNPALNDPSRH